MNVSVFEKQKCRHDYYCGSLGKENAADGGRDTNDIFRLSIPRRVGGLSQLGICIYHHW